MWESLEESLEVQFWGFPQEIGSALPRHLPILAIHLDRLMFIHTYPVRTWWVACLISSLSDVSTDNLKPYIWYNYAKCWVNWFVETRNIKEYKCRGLAHVTQLTLTEIWWRPVSLLGIFYNATSSACFKSSMQSACFVGPMLMLVTV